MWIDGFLTFLYLLKSYIDNHGFEEGIILLTGFLREIPSPVNPPRDSEVFLRLFLLICLLHIFAPCCGCGEFLRWYVFFQSSEARVVEVPMGPLEGSVGEMSLVTSGWVSWHALVSRKDCEVVSGFFLSFEPQVLSS